MGVTERIIQLTTTNVQRASRIVGIKIQTYIPVHENGLDLAREWSIVVSYACGKYDAIKFSDKESCEAEFLSIKGLWTKSKWGVLVTAEEASS